VVAGLQARLVLAVALLALAAVPARAEIDFSGSWVSINHEDALERGAGPNPADWAGLPFNDSGRAKALAFNQSVISEPERICWFQTQWHRRRPVFAVGSARSGDGPCRRGWWGVGCWRADTIGWTAARPSKNARSTGSDGRVEPGELVAATHPTSCTPPAPPAATSDDHPLPCGNLLTVTLRTSGV
jgi:hypothetical protein